MNFFSHFLRSLFYAPNAWMLKFYDHAHQKNMQAHIYTYTYIYV